MSAVMDLFEQTGAYLHGHFRLTSGLHSGEYLQCAKVLAYPAHAETLGQSLARKVKLLSPGSAFDIVVSPAMGGIIIGHEVARSMGTPFFFTERDAATNGMSLRRGFEIKPQQNAVVIEDVITTGGSTKEVIELLRSLGATVVAAGSIIDRSGGTAQVGVSLASLETLHPLTYNPDSCPLCQQGIPLVKPGSRPS